MSNKRTLMTPRTFGLFSSIAVLSVSAFTAYLVLAHPTSSSTVSNEPASSDTVKIDKSRTIASVSTSAAQSTSTVSPTAAEETGTDDSVTPSLGSQTPSQQVPVTQPSSAPTSPQKSNSSPQQAQSASGPSIVNILESAISTLTSALDVS